MRPLRRVHPLTSPTAEETRSVKVAFDFLEEDGGVLRARFEVEGGSPWVNPELGTASSQWGLWDWDVVELFVGVAPAAGLPCPCYYEFQVSPLNQYLELQIFEPRKRFDREYRSGFAHRAWRAANGQGWGAEMRIPARAIGLTAGSGVVVGNAFAILGHGNSKTYWSAFLPPQEKPDFHLPQFFQPLLG